MPAAHPQVVGLCLAGFVAAIRITCLLDMSMLRNTFVTSLARFTNLHAPASMEPKSGKAFRAMLLIAEDNADHLHVRPPPFSHTRVQLHLLDCRVRSLCYYTLPPSHPSRSPQQEEHSTLCFGVAKLRAPISVLSPPNVGLYPWFARHLNCSWGDFLSAGFASVP